MRQLRALTLVALAMFTFSVVAVASANAENATSILVLAQKVTELEAKATAGASKLETLGGFRIESATLLATVKNCKELESHQLSTNLCEGLLTFSGSSSKGASCRSETLAKVKDMAGTILSKVDLHLASDKNSAGVLQPLLISSILGVDGDNELLLNCGGVIEKVKGKVGCLLTPGLTNTVAGGTIEVACAITGGSNGDQETGTCELTKPLCEDLGKNPLEAKVSTNFEDSAIEFNAKGSFNKDVYIDD